MLVFQKPKKYKFKCQSTKTIKSEYWPTVKTTVDLGDASGVFLRFITVCVTCIYNTVNCDEREND